MRCICTGKGSFLALTSILIPSLGLEHGSGTCPSQLGGAQGQTRGRLVEADEPPTWSACPSGKWVKEGQGPEVFWSAFGRMRGCVWFPISVPVHDTWLLSLGSPGWLGDPDSHFPASPAE